MIGRQFRPRDHHDTMNEITGAHEPGCRDRRYGSVPQVERGAWLVRTTHRRRTEMAVAADLDRATDSQWDWVARRPQPNEMLSGLRWNKSSRCTRSTPTRPTVRSRSYC